jgi:hypothetical protein
VKKNFIRIGPCERARTQLSEYVWHMGVRMIIGQVITAQSQEMAAKVSLSPKLWGVTKKRHGHNFQNFGSKSNQRGTMWVSSTLIRFGAEILKIVAVSFFFNGPSLLFLKLKFELTSGAHNSASKSPNLENYHIFGILRTSAFTWSYPGWVIPVQNFE